MKNQISMRFHVIPINTIMDKYLLHPKFIRFQTPEMYERWTDSSLSEHHSFGQKEEDAGDYAESLAAEMLATTLGVEFNGDASWDEQKEYYRICGKIVRTTNITQSAIGDKSGLWTTVIAAAVFIPEENNG